MHIAIPTFEGIISFKIPAFILTETLFFIFTIPLVDRGMTFHLYRSHNLQLVHLMLQNLFSMKWSIDILCLGQIYITYLFQMMRMY